MSARNKYCVLGRWVGPTGQNLPKENPGACAQLHAFIKENLPFPKDGLCQHCHKRLVTCLASIEDRYSASLTDWEWSCQACNRRNPITMEKQRTSLKDNWAQVSPVESRPVKAIKNRQHSEAMKRYWNQIKEVELVKVRAVSMIKNGIFTDWGPGYPWAAFLRSGRGEPVCSSAGPQIGW